MKRIRFLLATLLMALLLSALGTGYQSAAMQKGTAVAIDIPAYNNVGVAQTIAEPTSPTLSNIVLGLTIDVANHTTPKLSRLTLTHLIPVLTSKLRSTDTSRLATAGVRFDADDTKAGDPANSIGSRNDATTSGIGTALASIQEYGNPAAGGNDIYHLLIVLVLVAATSACVIVGGMVRQEFGSTRAQRLDQLLCFSIGAGIFLDQHRKVAWSVSRGLVLSQRKEVMCG